MIRAALLFAALFAVLPELSHAQSGDARGILLKALNNYRNYHATLIQERMAGSTKIMVKTQVVPGVGVKTHLLAPVAYNGMWSFDDGKEMITVNPDEERVRIELSPVKYDLSPVQRARLVHANYVVSIWGIRLWLEERSILSKLLPKPLLCLPA